MAAVRRMKVRDGCLRAVCHAEAAVDLREVELDRVHTQLEAARGLCVRHTCGDELKDLELTRREGGQAVRFRGACSLVEHVSILGLRRSPAYSRWASVGPSRWASVRAPPRAERRASVSFGAGSRPLRPRLAAPAPARNN